jgi:hypothetical protein
MNCLHCSVICELPALTKRAFIVEHLPRVAAIAEKTEMGSDEHTGLKEQQGMLASTTA